MEIFETDNLLEIDFDLLKNLRTDLPSSDESKSETLPQKRKLDDLNPDSGKTDDLDLVPEDQMNKNRKISKLCREPGCEKYASFNYVYSKFEIRKPMFCKEHSKAKMRIATKKFCEHGECLEYAEYGYKATRTKSFCVDHKFADMISLMGRLCPIGDCSNRGLQKSHSNPDGLCVRHKNMISGPIDICVNGSCVEPAVYGTSQDRLLYCKEHKKKHMKHGSRKCATPDCAAEIPFGKSARTKYCELHEQREKPRKIQLCNAGCSEKAIFGKFQRGFCKLHKTDSMKRFHATFCIYSGCLIFASYYEAGYRSYCVTHAPPNSYRFERKCEFETCTSEATFGFSPTCTQFCVHHKQIGMSLFVKKRTSGVPESG